MIYAKILSPISRKSFSRYIRPEKQYCNICLQKILLATCNI